MGDGVQLALDIAREVGAFGQVLELHPIAVFVGAAVNDHVKCGPGETRLP